jgi:hypothetical protein
MSACPAYRDRVVVASLQDPRVFVAIVEAFGAFSSVIGTMSGLWAFIAWTSTTSSSVNLGERIANAVNFGIVFGFPAAAWFGVLAFEHALNLPAR